MPCALAAGNELALDAARQQAVLVLAGDEAREPVTLRGLLRLAQLLRGRFEQPMKRTLPERTSSSSARRVSSIGVAGSGRCSW